VRLGSVAGEKRAALQEELRAGEYSGNWRTVEELEARLNTVAAPIGCADGAIRMKPATMTWYAYLMWS
jgi:hypothetical protein